MQKRHGQYLQFAICCKADFCGIFTLPLQRPVKPVSVSVTPPPTVWWPDIHAPVAQWIEHRPPEPGAQVRILSGVPASPTNCRPLLFQRNRSRSFGRCIERAGAGGRSGAV